MVQRTSSRDAQEGTGQIADYRISVTRDDAPGLFSVLEKLCRRADALMPNEVSIEMSSNAWVRLEGHRRGTGRTILGIGYDLLAGLSTAELEAVLAHELTHAKFVQRGLKSSLNAGLMRTSKLASGLRLYVDMERRAKRESELA